MKKPTGRWTGNALAMLVPLAACAQTKPPMTPKEQAMGSLPCREAGYARCTKCAVIHVSLGCSDHSKVVYIHS